MLTKYFYDSTIGVLFFYVVQDALNAVGPSPLGSCCDDTKGECKTLNDLACPDFKQGESYYSCPPQGCITYTVRLDDSTYQPGPSKCGVEVSPGVYDIYSYMGGSTRRNRPRTKISWPRSSLPASRPRKKSSMGIMSCSI